MEKLLRKDVLKWIRNLQSGEYHKTIGSLTNEKGTGFCCLGVWADQHGCTWEERTKDFGYGRILHEVIPIPKGMKHPQKKQENGALHGKLTYGLSAKMQEDLTELNDDNKGWKKVISYIKEKILPKAI